MKNHTHRPRLQGFTLIIAALAATSLSPCALAMSDTIDAATELGITPESLVVAGVSGAEAGAILTRIAAATDERADVEDAHANLDAALTAYAAAHDAWRESPADPHLISTLNQAAAALTIARTELNDAHEILFDSAVVGVDAAAVDALSVCREALGYKVPAAYMAVEQTELQWIVIEEAVRARSRCDRTGEPLEEPHITTLATLESDPHVQLARTRLDNELAAMRAVFETFE